MNTPYTPQDALNIVTAARRAPLKNMDEADILSASIRKFVDTPPAQVAG